MKFCNSNRLFIYKCVLRESVLGQDTLEPQLCIVETLGIHGYVSWCHDMTAIMLKVV